MPGRDQVGREVLPVPDRGSAAAVTFDAKDSETTFPQIQRLRPPEGAPNVLVIVLDDVGFGASSAFGGPVHTPTAERLAGDGLKYTRFHTTAMCAPTRAALLTGRNHHSVGFGSITETATSAPGYNVTMPNTKATIQETLRLNGYATGMFGKCHEVPSWESSAAGPFDRWPTGNGFQYFFGFIAGETDQYYPAVYEGTTPYNLPRTPEQGYTFNEDLADHAIAWVRQQTALAPDQPFFTYYATGGTHAPHHVPTEWADKYQGAFDQGWDAMREQTFTRHSIPWVLVDQLPAFDDDVWELYDEANWTQAQARDLAKDNPQKLAELQRLFLLEAAKHNVFPLDDRRSERLNPALAGRPEVVQGNTQTLYPGMRAIPSEGLLNLKNVSHSITAEIDIPDDGGDGVLLNQGGVQNGWALYLRDGRFKYGYNLATLKQTLVESADPVPAGVHQVRMEFAYDGGGLGKGAEISLFIDGTKAADGRLDVTIPFTFGNEARSEVGRNPGSAVVPDYPAGSTFNGAINWIKIETGDDDHNHLSTPEQHLAYNLAQH